MSTAQDDTAGGSPSTRVEKIMSLSLGEFTTSIVRVAECRKIDSTSYRFTIGAHGRVDVTYQPQPGVTYGRLLHLPRAIVCLDFHDVSPTDRAGFTGLFDRTFQRGGG